MTPKEKVTDLQVQVDNLRRKLEQADHNIEEYRRVMEQATESLRKANDRMRKLEAAGDAMGKRFVWNIPEYVEWRRVKEEV